MTDKVSRAVGLLGLRSSTCFLCKWILEDIEKNGKLTERYPPQGPFSLDPLFPVEGKLLHLGVEGLAEYFVDHSRPVFR